MASDKSLEDRLLEFGKSLGSRPSSVDELYPLLDKIDSLLSRVEQSPSSSTLKALQPLMKELAAKELLGHSDMDVKAAVASCISEITRITAPEAPYDDDIMKEIFQMIVGVFETLHETSGRSFQKRVSVLETVAKVRSCVVMLDLECDSLILEMFQHFLKTIRDKHSDNVFSSMETIMSLVIEESEDISSDLLTCLLDSVKHNNKDVNPIAGTLAEKVMSNCAIKIKPCLLEFVQSTGAQLGEYGEVVVSICRGSSEALDHNELDHHEPHESGEVLVADSKLSERTVSDELPQASEKLEQEVACPENVDAAANTSPVAATSNGTMQMGNGDSMEQPSSPKQKSERSRRNGQSKNAIADCMNGDTLDSVAEKHDCATEPKKANGQKTYSSLQLTDTTDHSRVDSDKDASTVTTRKGGQAKKTVSSPDKKVEAADTLAPEENKEIEEHLASDNPTSISFPTPMEIPVNPVRPKRGRPPSKAAAKQRDVNAVAEKPASASGEKDNLATNQIDVVKVDDSEKITDKAAGSETPVTVMSESEVKPHKNSVKPSGRKRKGIKQQMEDNTSGKYVDGEPSLKEMTSPRPASEFPSGDQTHMEDSVKRKSRRKHARELENTSETPVSKKEVGTDLVGSKIKVWWPDDKKFYQGIIEDFDAITKKHKVLYDDGDIEHLILKNERWEFVDGDAEKEESKQIEAGIALQTPPLKKSISNALSKTTKSLTQTASGRESSGSVIRRRGRPRRSTSSLGKIPQDDSPMTSSKRSGKESSDFKATTLKSRSDAKDGSESGDGEGTPRPSTKQEEPSNRSKADEVDTPKTHEKSKDGPSRPGRPKKRTLDSSSKSKVDTLTISGKAEDEPRKRGRKPKQGTPDASSILKDDTPKDASKSKESTPKAASRSEDDDVIQRRHGLKKTKSTTDIAPTPKTSSDPKENGISSKGETTRVGESSATAGLGDGEAKTGGTEGRKRKRKGSN